MSALERQIWRAASAMWLVWAGHVYFDAEMSRCLAVFFLALMLTVAGSVHALNRVGT